MTIPFEIASEKEGKGDSKEEKKESLKGIHLLLAEDNELNVEVARELLKSAERWFPRQRMVRRQSGCLKRVRRGHTM